MESDQINRVLEWNKTTKDFTPLELLWFIDKEFNQKAVFTTSLGKEDQYLTHLMAEKNLSIKWVTLDTGRLFPESYDLLSKTESKYQIKIHTYFPKTQNVETYSNQSGVNAFYDSVELRKRCCAIRKIEPLKRAIKGAEAWITGIRADQNEHREKMERWEWDSANQIIKVHPLLFLSSKELEEAIEANNIPVNPLHNKGFKSIGCAPCTRAVELGEHERAGRWWWEQDKKECGLHLIES